MLQKCDIDREIRNEVAAKTARSMLNLIHALNGNALDTLDTLERIAILILVVATIPGGRIATTKEFCENLQEAMKLRDLEKFEFNPSKETKDHD